MPAVGTAIAALGTAFKATTLGNFLTTNIIGRLITSVALSALQVALAGTPDVTQAGIRTQQTQTGGITPASFIVGEYATEGQLLAPPMSHGEDGKTPNAYLTYVIELGDIPGQSFDNLILDGERAELSVEFHEDYGFPIGGRFTDYAWVKYYDGTQTTADPMLLDKYGDDPDRPWLTDMIGAGLNYAIVTFRYNREIYTSFPSVRFEMTGIPLYDPRHDSSVGGSGPQRWNDRSTWQPTENVVVQVYCFLRGIDLGGGHIWGGEADADDLPLSTWWAEMNKADLAIPKQGGGTEPQWRASYEIFVDDEPAKIIEDLLRGCSGKLVENGGIWKIRLGAPGLPVYFFTDDDVAISEGAEVIPFSAGRKPHNGVAGVYPDPAQLWEPKDAPSLYDTAFEAQDGGQRRVADLTFSATPYPLQVQRAMRGYQHDERRLRQHVVNLPPEVAQLEPLDVVAWSSNDEGYLNKEFEISSLLDPLTSGTPQVRLREVDASDYNWEPSFELPIGYANLNRTPLANQPVAGFDLRAVAVEDADGDQRRPALEIVWDGDGQDDVRGIMWEIRLTGTTEVLLRGQTSDVSAGLQLVTEGILPATSYQARAQWIVDRPTDWTDWEEATTGNILFGEKDFRTGFFDDIIAAAQIDFERANLNVDFIIDEYEAANIVGRIQAFKEDTRIQGMIEETRVTVNTEKAKVEELRVAAETDQAALATLEQTISTDLGSISGEFSSLVVSLSERDEQFTLYQIDIDARFFNERADIDLNFYTKIDADNAIAAAIETFETTGAHGTLSTTVSQVTSSVNGVLGQWAIRINNNGVISGISLLSEAVDGVPASALIVDATTFSVGTSDQPGNFTTAFRTSGNTTYLDNIMVEDGSFTRLKIGDNQITAPYYINGSYMVGDGTFQLVGSALIPVPAQTTVRFQINCRFDQGYANASPTWGFRVVTSGFNRSRDGMTFGNDYPDINFQTQRIVNNLSTDQLVGVYVYWKGSSADITATGSAEINVLFNK